MPISASPATQLLGSRIRERRLTLGLSQEDVAHLAGMHLTNYGRIERGTSGPSFPSFLKIASVLELDPAELVRGMDGTMVESRPHKLTASDLIKARGL